jgi:hypothetical protein
MNANPFAADGDAREREEALFDFLVAQVRAPKLAAWSRLAPTSGCEEDVGYCALLLSNLVERRAPQQAVTALYAIAEQLLSDKLNPASFELWLRKGLVDVPRLSDYLEHELSAAA